MQRLVIHKLGVGSLGRLVGVYLAIISFFVGIVSAVVSTVSVFQNNDFSILGGVGVAALIVLGWVIFYPLVMFLIGWLNGALVAIIFNVVVTGSGGLSVHVEETALDGTPAKK